MLPQRVVRLLDVLVGVIVGLQLVAALLGMLHFPPWQTVFGLLGVALAGGGWLGWRVSGRRWALLALVAGAFVLATSVDAPGVSALTFCVAMAMLTMSFSRRVALIVAGVFVGSYAAYMALGSGEWRFWGGLVELLGTFAILSLGIILGEVLRALSCERRRNAELLEETRRAAVVEQELMLAEERARSARELHDGLGHQLTMVVLGLEYAERMRDRQPDKAFAEMQRAQETASAALAHMRRWVRALNPPRAEAVTGNDAFDAIARSFRGTGMDVVVTHEGQERALDRDASLFALRMVQEGLTNALRHSTAQRVDLHVGWRPSSLRLELSNDGGAPATLVPGFGLRSLAERAEALGGSFQATAVADGVRLIGEIPTVAA